MTQTRPQAELWPCPAGPAKPAAPHGPAAYVEVRPSDVSSPPGRLCRGEVLVFEMNNVPRASCDRMP